MASLFYVLGGYKGYGLSILCLRWIQRLWSLYFMFYVDTKAMASLFYVLGGYKGYGLSILCFRWIQRLWPLYFMF
jgi:hypothetical protein